MSMLTIAEIAERLHLPESTVRYYRDHFTAYIPVSGEGRQRRYPAEAVEVFQVIADKLRKNHGSATEVEETLSRLFPRNAVTTAGPPQTTTEQQQLFPQLAEQIAVVLKQQQDALSQQAQAIETLTAEVAALRHEQDAREEARNRRLEERDQALVQTMRRLMEPPQSKSVWQRLFGAKTSSTDQ